MSSAASERARRILVVTTWFPDQSTPSRTPFIVEHVKAIRQAGHQVSVLHLALGSERDQPITLGDVSVERVPLDPRRPWTVLTAWTHVWRMLDDADVLHTMAFSTVGLCVVPWLARRRPWVHTEHWNGVVDPRSMGRAWRAVGFLRHALRLPHRVTGVTTQLSQEMERFTRAGATSVVPCVVQRPAMLAPFPERPPLHLVAVGLLIPRKDPVRALEVIAALRHRGVDVHFTWVGDGPLRQQAVALAEKLGLAERVVFTGPVPPGMVPELLGNAHLFMLPSHQENFFTAVAESIACGRPAVVPLSGGFDDYCTEANSRLIHTWDVDELADAVLLARDELLQRTPEEISATLGDRFDRAGVGRAFSSLYRQVDVG